MTQISDFQREVGEAVVAKEVANRSVEANKAVLVKGTEFCVDCGVKISEARRKAAPFATRCIVCQTAKERG